MPDFLMHYQSFFFFLGLLVVMAFAWRRFNEPSFHNRETLPRTVDPLRYLFLKPAYRRARLTYVVGVLLLYGALVAPGPKIVPALGAVGAKDFPAEGWALLAALILTGVGLAPDAVKWVNMIEDQLRRFVHEWFLVPDGIEQTIGVLEDARYDPPYSQLNLLDSPLREMLQEDLKLDPGTLRHSWARATILLTSLKQVGAGAVRPLQRAAFDPFREDLKALLVTYRALKPDVQARADNQVGGDQDDDLVMSVNTLLNRIYAYISWGVLRQAHNERDVDQTLEELGFRIPKTGGRRLFDTVAPAILLVALITIAFWVAVDTVNWAMDRSAHSTFRSMSSDSIVAALSSAMTASAMYGCVVLIALKRRWAQIEKKSWLEGSPRCLIPIAILAGLATWALIVATTVLSDAAARESLAALGYVLASVATRSPASGLADTEWTLLPTKIATGLPWLLVGGIASAVLANCVSGDVRRTDNRQRIQDAISLGIAVGLTAAAAQWIQGALTVKFGVGDQDLSLVPAIGLAGFACGAVIGLKVPVAYRLRLVSPRDQILARALRELLRQAEEALGTKAAAEDWVFTPHAGLGGITPAEAVQHKTNATNVGRLLENDTLRGRVDTKRVGRDRIAPFIIEGGRKADLTG